jgi:antitoxin PrlF
MMETAARMTSKGQVTVPKAVRDALSLAEGDSILFRVEGSRAVIAKTPDFLDLAGTIAVPASMRNVAWDEVLHRTRRARAHKP